VGYYFTPPAVDTVTVPSGREQQSAQNCVFMIHTAADGKLLDAANLKEHRHNWNASFVNDAGSVWTDVLWVCGT
jgi:hypothetical protein